MAKSSESVDKKFPDVSVIFAAREKRRQQRANESPAEKLLILGELQELSKILKGAKIVKKGGVSKPTR